MRAILASAALIAAVGVGGLAAQQPEPAPQRPMRMRIHMPDSARANAMQGTPRMQGMMGQRGMVGQEGRAAPYTPGMLLRFKGFLDLTDDQVSQLEDLEQGVQTAHQNAQSTIQEQRTALREAWQADKPDVNAIRQHVEALSQAREQVQLQTVTAAAQAKGLLTAEQQGKLSGWMEGRRAGSRMRGMQQQRRPGMMMRQRPGMRMPARGPGGWQ
jgi:Spy/CpxP family protein refolding chaperone